MEWLYILLIIMVASIFYLLYKIYQIETLADEIEERTSDLEYSVNRICKLIKKGDRY